MKRTFVIASTLLVLCVGTDLPVANASTTPATINAGTVFLASAATAGNNKKEKKEVRQAQKAAERTERLNRQSQSNSSRESARGGGSNDRSNGNANRDRGNSGNRDRDRGGSSRNDRHDSYSSRDRDRDRGRGHSSRNNRHDDHGVHISVGSGGVHFGVHTDSHGGHSSYGHSSYRHSTHHHSRPYRYYQPRTYYQPHYRYTTPVIEREIVVIEREPVVRQTVVVQRPSASSVDGLRGWDFLIHGESSRALGYFSDLAQTYMDAGLPKLGFGFSALAQGDIRNGAHGIRRAFEFGADEVSGGPSVDGFDELVAEMRAGVEHRIETDATLTSDHWFLSAAMAFYDSDYGNAQYSIDAAKNLGDASRGCVALARMIDAKVAYEQSMR